MQLCILQLSLASTGTAAATATTAAAHSLFAAALIVHIATAVCWRPAAQLSLAHTAVMLRLLPLRHAVLVEHVSTRCHTLSSSVQLVVADAALVLSWSCSDH
jgi:hypothetical protein